MPAAGEEIFHRGRVFLKNDAIRACSHRFIARVHPAAPARAAGEPADHLRHNFFLSAQRDQQHSKFFRRMTLVRNRPERDCAITRKKNVIPSADVLCGSLSPTRWSPRQGREPPASSAEHRKAASDPGVPTAATSASFQKKDDLRM